MMGTSSFAAILLASFGWSSAEETDQWLWQFADDEEETAWEQKQKTWAMEESIQRGAEEITRLLQMTSGLGEGEGDGADPTPKPPTPTPPTPAPPTSGASPPSPAPTLAPTSSSTPAPPTPGTSPSPAPPSLSPAPTPAQTSSTPAPTPPSLSSAPTLAPTSSSPGQPLEPTTTPTTPSSMDSDDITVSFSFEIQSSRPVSELKSDQHFISELKKVGLKVLGLSIEQLDWITVALTSVAPRRLSLSLRRRLSSDSISVDYSAHIPEAAVDDVSIVSDSAAVKSEVEVAIHNAEIASGISYGVTVDSSSINALTKDLGPVWAAAVASKVGTSSTTTKENDELQYMGLASASSRIEPVNFIITVVQVAVVSFGIVVA